jgi:hypothetical protein
VIDAAALAAALAESALEEEEGSSEVMEAAALATAHPLRVLRRAPRGALAP